MQREVSETQLTKSGWTDAVVIPEFEPTGASSPPYSLGSLNTSLGWNCLHDSDPTLDKRCKVVVLEIVRVIFSTSFGSVLKLHLQGVYWP